MSMKQKTESMFEKFRISDDVTASLDIPESSMSDSNLDLFEDFDISRWRFGNEEQIESELERYLKSSLMILQGKEVNKSFDVLEWWKANKAEYPTLFRIAIELFSIPGMSAEVERVFSGCVTSFCSLLNYRAKQTITDRRNRLRTDSVQCIECLHHWLASDIITGVSTELLTDRLMILDE